MTAVQETPVLSFGPVQLLVLEFDRVKFDGEVMPEFERLKQRGIIRLIDLLFVRKIDGELEFIQKTDLTKDEAEEFGAIVGALIGAGTGDEEEIEKGMAAGAAEGFDRHLLDEGDVWFVADAIPDGSSAAIVLIEHRWAIPLRDKLVRAGGQVLADEWVHPADLMAVGALLADRGVAPAGV